MWIGLAERSDSRGLARKYAEAKSLEMMKRFVAEASPAEILKMQQKLDVVRDDRLEHGGNQLIVMLGTQERPLEPPVIEVQSLDLDVPIYERSPSVPRDL